MIQFIANKVMDFVSRHGLTHDCKVFVAGIAFKGVPETSDIRNSTSLDVIDQLAANGMTHVEVFDPVVGHGVFSAARLHPATTLKDGFQDATAVLFMNNHPSFRKNNIFHLLESMSKPGLFFDGWHEFKQGDVESVPGIEYHGLGVARSADHSD
jgi:UDP-N-acetyl-D-mannosaminuronic acid dehydrogenase